MNAGRPAVRVEVGECVELREFLAAEFAVDVAFQFAETATESDLLPLGQGLTWKDQHVMGMKGVEDGIELAVVDAVREVDADDFGADRAGLGANLQLHLKPPG